MNAPRTEVGGTKETIHGNNRIKGFMNRNTTPDKENHNQDQIKISHEEIAKRASQLWELAGHPVGRDAEYWLQAEAELLAARQCVRLPDVGVRRRVRSTKQASRLSQPFQDKKPAQKAAPMQEQVLRR
jgi:hypothetical protein